MSTPINIPDGSLWEHNQTGNRYRIIAVSNLGAVKSDWKPTVTYRSLEDGKVRSRPLHEWTMEKYSPIPEPKPQQEYDYHKMLLAYLKHVGECEGVTFLYSRGQPIGALPGLTQDEMDELIRMDEMSDN